MDFKYPVYQPSLEGNEQKYVQDCLQSTWISSKGKYISLFEENFAKYIGAKYASSVSNGTVALHLAMIALGISKGDEVIVPTLTYIASVNAISYVGATPVFADCDLNTWQIDPNEIIKKINRNTKAVLVVHLYGQSSPMHEISKICKENNLLLIEDCAEAIGSQYFGQKVGTFGDISAFSFFGNKTITTGEGGMLLTNDETLIDRINHYKGQGLAKYREYWHDVIGYNFRMTNICAAIGLAQLERINNTIEKKRNLATWYQKNLSHLQLTFQTEAPGTFHTYWMNSILTENNIVRDKLREHLKTNQIDTRPVFYPVHTMPMYSTKYQKFANSEYIGWRGINLPSYPDLNEEDVYVISQCIKSFFNHDS